MPIKPIWPFTPQPNKWGYPNNPRWTDTPSAPVNYDGREDEEPQVWESEFGVQSRYPLNGTKQHIPCGHWHKQEMIDNGVDNEIETYIELLSSGCCFPMQQTLSYASDPDQEDGPLFDATYYATYRQLDTGDYDGTTLYTFEIVCANISEKNSGFVYLVDETDAIVATIEVPQETMGPKTEFSDGTGGTNYRSRNYYVFSTTFNPVIGSHQYALRTAIANTGWRAGWGAGDAIIKVANARIVIHQWQTTKSVVHIPMMVLVNWCQMDWMSTPHGMHVVTDGRETGGLDIGNTNYADCDDGDYANECRQVWQFDSNELSTLDKIVFDAGIAYIPLDSIAASSSTFFGVPTLTAIALELRWCITDSLPPHDVSGTFGDATVSDGLGNTFYLVEDSFVEWVLSRDGSAWERTVELDVASLTSASGKYLYMCTMDNVYGGDTVNPPLSHWNRLRAFTVPSGRELHRAWIRYYYSYNTSLSRHEVKLLFDYELKPANIDNGYVILYDKTDDVYVPGSELIWSTFSPWSRQSVELNADLFISGHEYQARWKTEGLVGATLPMVTDVNLWAKVENLTAFTSYLRVAKAWMDDWRFPGVYSDWRDDATYSFYLDPSSRAKPYIPVNGKVYYEFSASEIDVVESKNESIWDTGVATDGAIGINVSGSVVAVASTDFHTKRFRSLEITEMVNGNYYIANLPGQMYGNHYMISGFIVVQQVGG